MTYPWASFQGLDCPCDYSDPAVHVLRAVCLQNTPAQIRLCLLQAPGAARVDPHHSKAWTRRWTGYQGSQDICY